LPFWCVKIWSTRGRRPTTRTAVQRRKGHNGTPHAAQSLGIAYSTLQQDSHWQTRERPAHSTQGTLDRIVSCSLSLSLLCRLCLHRTVTQGTVFTGYGLQSLSPSPVGPHRQHLVLDSTERCTVGGCGAVQNHHHVESSHCEEYVRPPPRQPCHRLSVQPLFRSPHPALMIAPSHVCARVCGSLTLHSSVPARKRSRTIDSGISSASMAR
jgi:hypothetical protein